MTFSSHMPSVPPKRHMGTDCAMQVVPQLKIIY